MTIPIEGQYPSETFAASVPDAPLKRPRGRPRKQPTPQDVQSLTSEPVSKAPRRGAQKMATPQDAYDIVYPALEGANALFISGTTIGKLPGMALTRAELEKECKLLCEVPALRVLLAKADNAYLKLIAFNTVLVIQRVKLLRELKQQYDSMTPEQREQMQNFARQMNGEV